MPDPEIGETQGAARAPLPQSPVPPPPPPWQQGYAPPSGFGGPPGPPPGPPGTPPGYYYPPPYAPQKQSTNGFSIASMVLGIVWLYGIGSILALIFGYVARGQIKRSNGREGGNGMAIAGIVLGWVGVVGVIFIFVVLASFGHSVSRAIVKSQQCASERSTVTVAAEAYRAKTGKYPTSMAQLTTGNPPLLPQTPADYTISPSGLGYAVAIPNNPNHCF